MSLELPGMPNDFQALADEIRHVQQRISGLRATPAVQFRLSRALRRAVHTGRRDPMAGRAGITRLMATLDSFDADQS